MYYCGQGKYRTFEFSVELDDLEYAVNNMNGKNTFERISAVEEKSANLHIFVALMWMPILKQQAIFLSFRIYTWSCQRGGGRQRGHC